MGKLKVHKNKVLLTKVIKVEKIISSGKAMCLCDLYCTSPVCDVINYDLLQFLQGS